MTTGVTTGRPVASGRICDQCAHFDAPATNVRDCILVMSKAAGEELIRFLCRPRLLIVDEIGYLPVVAGGGNLGPFLSAQR
ncbi:hypothetical protein D9M69_199520 [compost metagenome]